MAKSKSNEPPKPTIGDHVHTVARAGFGSLPVVGSAAAELFNAVVIPPLEKRRDQWRESVGERLKQLESDDRISIDDLESNDNFINAVMRASQAALKTHQIEKLNALRNAVVNTALPNPPDETMQQIFIQLIDELSVWHLRFLDLFRDPSAWFERNNKKRPEFSISSSLTRLLEAAYPDLAADKELTDLIAADLGSRKLFSAGGMNTMMSPQGAWSKRTTEMGDQFLKFISDLDNAA
jgi:hypothetical protein